MDPQALKGMLDLQASLALMENQASKAPKEFLGRMAKMGKQVKQDLQGNQDPLDPWDFLVQMENL